MTSVETSPRGKTFSIAGSMALCDFSQLSHPPISVCSAHDPLAQTMTRSDDVSVSWFVDPGAYSNKRND